MKKNVYRNFDFVVRQTDKMKAIQKITWNAFFFRFLPFIDSSSCFILRTRYRLLKKNHYFSKMKVMTSLGVIPYKHFQPPDPCAHFIFTLQKVSPPRSTARAKTSEFRSLLADLGHFLTSDVILKENFCRLASIWLIGLMKLFALGRIDSAVGRKLWLAGKVGKFTEMVVIPLRILSSVGEAWRPPGHPRRLRPVQVVSLLDTVVCSYSELCWWGLFVLICGVRNITEILLNIPSSIEFIYFLRFHLACFSCFRTAQTTANNRHVFRVD